MVEIKTYWVEDKNMLSDKRFCIENEIIEVVLASEHNNKIDYLKRCVKAVYLENEELWSGRVQKLKEKVHKLSDLNLDEHTQQILGEVLRLIDEVMLHD